MDSNSVFFIVVGLLIFLFWGEPDVHSAIITYLNEYEHDQTK
jgi:hypothetical protein